MPAPSLSPCLPACILPLSKSKFSHSKSRVDNRFDVTSILNADLSLNEEAWEQSRPMLLTPYFALSYALSFAALSSILVHVYLWHRGEIKEGEHNQVLCQKYANCKPCRVVGSWTMFTSKLSRLLQDMS
jgi:hypothetical protein